MNQKNVFTVIGAVLLLQGIGMYAMGNKMMADTFPNLDPNGQYAVINLAQVLAILSILVGLISFATKNVPGVLWAYTLGFGLFGPQYTKAYIYRPHQCTRFCPGHPAWHCIGLLLFVDAKQKGTGIISGYSAS